MDHKVRWMLELNKLYPLIEDSFQIYERMLPLVFFQNLMKVHW